MPFRSKAQQRKAFATGGFGGKIDLKEWANKTNFKKLPERVKESNMLQPPLAPSVTTMEPMQMTGSREMEGTNEQGDTAMKMAARQEALAAAGQMLTRDLLLSLADAARGKSARDSQSHGKEAAVMANDVSGHTAWAKQSAIRPAGTDAASEHPHATALAPATAAFSALLAKHADVVKFATVVAPGVNPQVLSTNQQAVAAAKMQSAGSSPSTPKVQAPSLGGNAAPPKGDAGAASGLVSGETGPLGQHNRSGMNYKPFNPNTPKMARALEASFPDRNEAHYPLYTEGYRGLDTGMMTGRELADYCGGRMETPVSQRTTKLAVDAQTLARMNQFLNRSEGQLNAAQGAMAGKKLPGNERTFTRTGQTNRFGGSIRNLAKSSGVNFSEINSGQEKQAILGAGGLGLVGAAHGAYSGQPGHKLQQSVREALIGGGTGLGGAIGGAASGELALQALLRSSSRGKTTLPLALLAELAGYGAGSVGGYKGTQALLNNVGLTNKAGSVKEAAGFGTAIPAALGLLGAGHGMASGMMTGGPAGAAEGATLGAGTGLGMGLGGQLGWRGGNAIGNRMLAEHGGLLALARKNPRLLPLLMAAPLAGVAAGGAAGAGVGHKATEGGMFVAGKGMDLAGKGIAKGTQAVGKGLAAGKDRMAKLLARITDDGTKTAGFIQAGKEFGKALYHGGMGLAQSGKALVRPAALPGTLAAGATLIAAREPIGKALNTAALQGLETVGLGEKMRNRSYNKGYDTGLSENPYAGTRLQDALSETRKVMNSAVTERDAAKAQTQALQRELHNAQTAAPQQGGGGSWLMPGLALGAGGLGIYGLIQALNAKKERERDEAEQRAMARLSGGRQLMLPSPA